MVGYTENGKSITEYDRLSREQLRSLVWPLIEEDINRKAYDLRYLRLFGTSAGLLLSQLVFWGNKGHDVEGWIYKTKDEIIEEFGLGSRYEVDQARHRLETEGVLETKRRPRYGWRDGEWRVRHPSPVLHYRVDFLALAKRLEDPEQRSKQSRVSAPEAHISHPAQCAHISHPAQCESTALMRSNGRGSTVRIERGPAFESDKAGRSYTESTSKDNVAKKNQTESSPLQGAADSSFAESAARVNQERKKQLKDGLAAMGSNWRMEDDLYDNDRPQPKAAQGRPRGD